MKIKWTPRSKSDYISIIDHLHQNWTEKELMRFINKTEKVLMLISKTPHMFPVAQNKNVRKCVLTKQVLLFYAIRKNEVELLSFWGSKQDQRRLKL